MEDQLRRQPLRRPGVQLDERIEALLEAAPEIATRNESPVRWRIVPWMMAGSGFTAAAAVAVMAWMGGFDGSSATQRPMIASVPAPVEITETWTTVEPGELIYLEGESEPVRTAHYQSVQQTRWIDPQTRARIELTIPDEQVLLIPAEAY
jgi:hypothetical protein